MNIFITGTSQGLGKEIALHLLNKGENVFGYSLNDFNYKNNDFKEFILKEKFFHFCGSITDIKKLDSAIELFCKTFGDIDVLINNAGLKHHNTPDLITDEEYINVINTNLTYQILLTQRVIKK